MKGNSAFIQAIQGIGRRCIGRGGKGCSKHTGRLQRFARAYALAAGGPAIYERSGLNEA